MSESPLKQNIVGKRLDASKIVTKMIPIDAIEDHPENYNGHPAQQLMQLSESHAEFGQYRTILVWERPGGKYIRVLGHGYSKGAEQKGETVLRCEVLPQDTDPVTVKAIMMGDNLHAKNSEPNDEGLAALLQEQQDAGFDLASLGTDDEYLRQLLEGLGDEYLGNEGEDEEDDFEAEPDEEQTRVKLGDVWQLGRHTIACVDSTDQKAYKKLLNDTIPNMIFADPPYGVKERTQRKTAGRSKLAECNDFSPVIGDDKPFDPSFILSLPAQIRIIWGANYFSDKLPNTSSWIVWDKREGIPSNDNADCELAWTNAGGPARLFAHRWNGMIKASEQGERRVHPTQKPVALAEYCFDKYGSEQDVIFDPFLGSGISVIAAEKMPGERKVIGCELSPAYIDVCITRWEQLTGQQATLLDRVEEATHA
jgi:site-specific DNA-methyltransferase (adenine-specific)/modification methylase